jgi:anti-anti-sigma factor
MLFETYEVGKFQVLRIKEKKNAIRNLEELKDLISGYLDRGKYCIALSFSDATYIYSGAIKVLISCHKMISEKGGELCIIEPDPTLFDILENLNIDQVIKIYVSEKYLPQ